MTSSKAAGVLAMALTAIALLASRPIDEASKPWSAGRPDTYRNQPAQNGGIVTGYIPPLRSAPRATFRVNYTGFSAEARAAFQFATDIWAAQLTTPVPIVVNAYFISTRGLDSNATKVTSRFRSGARPRQLAGPTDISVTCTPDGPYASCGYAANFPRAPVRDTWYPIALANKLAGFDLAPSESYLTVFVGGASGSLYFGIDGRPGANQADFVSLALHELGHALGFVGSGTCDPSTGLGNWSWGVPPAYVRGFPAIFDRFVVNGQGQYFIDTSVFPKSSAALFAQLTGNNLFWRAPVFDARLFSPAKLYAPAVCQPGSTYSHLDESTYGLGDPNSLMTPVIGEAAHDPGPIVRAMFEAMGWTILPSFPPLPTPTPAPTPSPAPTPTAGAGALDMNGDGLGDAFRYDVAGGMWSKELGNGAGSFSSFPGTWDPGWTIFGAEFSGDARSDLFLFHPVTGSWTKAYSDAGGGFTYTTGAWSTGWDVHVLDLSGDGRSDVFLYNASTGVWFKCLHQANGDFTYFSSTWSPQWKLYPADWNGDGIGDLFLYNSTTGQWFRAKNDSGPGFDYHAESWSPGWSVYPGDFNADGKTDIFLYNPTSGDWFVCTNTGDTFGYTSGTWSPGWSIQVGDFDANGSADMFLYNTTTTGTWFQVITGTGLTFTYHSSRWDPGWQVWLTDVNADRKSDVLLYNSATGTYVQAINAAPGAFNYTTGTWPRGLGVTATMAKLP